MATIKFSQMATKRLVKMLETATDEEKVEIQKVIDARQAAMQAPAESMNEAIAEESKLTPEEQAAIDAAEANGGINPMYVGKGDDNDESKKKMTDDERKALAEEVKSKYMGHRCRIVPFNTVEWVNGVVSGVVEEKRTNKILVAVKTDDGRRIVKTYGSKLLEILDEVVEITRAPRGRNKKEGEQASETESVWSAEEVNEAIQSLAQNVGRKISYPKFSITEAPKEGEAQIIEEGRIVSLVPDKRGKRILYRIEIDQTQDEIEAKMPKRLAHKVSSNSELKLAEEMDEIGLAINTKFIARREKAIENALLTPEQKVQAAKASLELAEKQLKKIQNVVDERVAAYAAAKKALDDYLKAEIEKCDTEDNNATQVEELA